MNRKSCYALSLSVVIAGCTPSAQPTGTPGSVQTTAQITSLFTSAKPSGNRDSLSVKVAKPQSSRPVFSVSSAETAQAVYVRLTIKAVDLQRDYTNSGGITLNSISNLVAFAGGSATLTVEEIPPGKNRIVIAQLYNAEGQELTSLRAMGLYHSRTATVTASRFTDADPGTNVIEQTVSRRNIPVLSTLEQAINNKDTAFIDQIENHLEALATEFDKLLYGANPPGSTFVTEPQRIDPAEVYAALKTQLQSTALTLPTGLPSFFTAQTPSIVDSTSSVTVHLATPTGFNFTQNLTVVVDDPGSSPVSLNAAGMSSPQTVTLTNVERGSRRLTVYGPGNLVLGHTTVTIDPDTGTSFAGNAGSSGASPLFLMGGETGIVISSLSQTSAVQNTAVTLNGVGFEPSPNHANNSTKFGPHAAVLENSTNGTAHILVPDLIGGTYPVTITRLGVTSNFINFNVLPQLTATSVPNGIITSPVTLTGTGFDPNPLNNSVRFGAVNATVLAATPDGHSLTVTVPAGVHSLQSINLTVGGQLSNSLNYGIRPNLTSLSDNNGVIGSTITLTGSGFAPTAAANKVRFGGVQVPTADVNPMSNTQLSVKVPAGIWDSRNVTVEVDGLTSNALAYEVKPQITDTSPNGGVPGIFITLTGTGFSPVESENTVKFGSIILGQATANVNQATTTSLKVVVFPVIVGALPVTVKVGNQTSDGSIFQSTFPPAITSLSLSAACPGSVIQINGSQFSPMPGNNQVKFGSVSATVQSGNANQLTVVVPPGTGTQNVTVTVDGNESNPSSFSYGGGPIFVDAEASGAGNGTNWANAWTTLTGALAAPVCAGSEIWVKAGTYKPGALRTDSFQLADIPVFGGFAGTETLRSQRNFVTHPTILSGDISGNDDYETTPAGNISDNSLHVVKAGNNSVLDGLIIKGGNADGAALDGWGGGLQGSINNAVLTVRNTVFEFNQASNSGAGLAFTTNATTSYENVVFYKNSGASNGGASLAEQGGTHTYTNVLIADNLATSRHYISNGTVVFNQVTMANNVSSSGDSRILLTNSGTLTMNNSIVWGNTPGPGCNGIRIGNNTVLTLNNTLYQGAVPNCIGTGGSFADFNSTNTDPVFLAPGNAKGADGKFFTVDDGYNLTAGSASVLDNGDNSKLPGSLLLDITGITNRLINVTVDRGAYEKP